MVHPFPLRHGPAPHVWVRDAFHIVAFLDGVRDELGQPVTEALRRYQASIEPEALAWIASGGENRALTERRSAAMLARLSSPKNGQLVISAKGGCAEHDVAAYGFEYWGAAELAGAKRNAVAFSYPSEWALERPVEVVRAAVLDILGDVPVVSGYASLAIHEASSPPGMVQGLAERHPGLDVHHLSSMAAHVGDGVRGAYWMTVLGPIVLQKLGLSTRDLGARLGAEIRVDALGDGVAIMAGDELRPGDAAVDRLPLTRRVAQVIEPARFVQRRGVFGFRGDDAVDRFVAWHRRHLEEPPA